MNLKRAKLEELATAFIEKTLKPCETVLNDAGIKTGDINEVILVGGMTRMPAVREAVKKFFGKEPNHSVNPDEAVAIGAAIQGGILGGEVKDLLLLDVTPLSLGIETLGGVMTRLIDKNTTIPTSKSQVFSTAADNQTQVDIHVLQGEREMASDNRTLGRFILDGIPPAPRGIPQVEVAFDIDANGIVNVKATDKASGKEQKITITSSSGLSEEEIEKMKKDAEVNAEADKKKRQTVDAKNAADSLIFTTEKVISENGEKLDSNIKKDLEDKIKNLKEIKESDNLEEIKTQTETLSKSLQEAGASLYQQAGAANPSDQPGSDQASGRETDESSADENKTDASSDTDGTDASNDENAESKQSEKENK